MISWAEMQKDSDDIKQLIQSMNNVIISDTEALNMLDDWHPMIEKLIEQIEQARKIKHKLIEISNEIKEYALDKFLDK